MKRLLMLTFVVMALAGGKADAAAFRQPVDAPVVDKFRPPSNPYGRGNRGWEYELAEDEQVRAPAEGVVQFAGQVGGVLNVVILHDNGLRTTLSKLAEIDAAVKKGARIETDQAVGRARDELFFGVRCGQTYLDPASFIKNRVYLVDTEGTGAATNQAVVCDGNITASEMAWLSQSMAATEATAVAAVPAASSQKATDGDGWVPAAAGFGGLGVAASALALRRPGKARV